jgi:hypothetical protein
MALTAKRIERLIAAIRSARTRIPLMIGLRTSAFRLDVKRGSLKA